MTNRITLLVTGASGHLGRRVLELLLASDSAQARTLVASTRTPDKIADLAARGVTVRAASFEEPASLASAFRGVDRALLISTDAVDRPGRRIAQHRAAVDAAKAAGVSHVVYTSLTHADPDSLVTIAPDHWATERAIIDSGLSHALLRNNMYTDYLLHGLPHAVRAGRISNSFGSGAVSYVTREDCAHAAAAALASAFEGRARFDITGPAAITQSELAKIASDVTGRRVEYEAVDANVATRQLVASGMPEPIADLLVSFERSGQAGQLAVASPALRGAHGRRAHELARLSSRKPRRAGGVRDHHDGCSVARRPLVGPAQPGGMPPGGAPPPPVLPQLSLLLITRSFQASIAPSLMRS